MHIAITIQAAIAMTLDYVEKYPKQKIHTSRENGLKQSKYFAGDILDFGEKSGFGLSQSGPK